MFVAWLQGWYVIQSQQDSQSDTMSPDSLTHSLTRSLARSLRSETRPPLELPLLPFLLVLESNVMYICTRSSQSPDPETGYRQAVRQSDFSLVRSLSDRQLRNLLMLRSIAARNSEIQHRVETTSAGRPSVRLSVGRSVGRSFSSLSRSVVISRTI